ncbi:MAG: hypothetical protein NC218_01660 [Acetobacter sp.]|nr:hypothetical protein [Acetobacter sp.]
MITPKSPIPVHRHFAAKNTSLGGEPNKPQEPVVPEVPTAPEAPADEVVLDARDIASVEEVNEIPEGAEVHDGAVITGTDEEVDPILDAIKTEEERKAAVSASDEEIK